MSRLVTVAKVLIVLAIVAFLVAVFDVVFWPVFGVAAEAASRAANNLALIAIALLLLARESKGRGASG